MTPRRKEHEVTEELYRDGSGIISHHPEDAILELEWLEGSAQERRTPNMLVDVTRFGHSPGEHVGPWRDDHIIPRYNAAGVKRFAFLVPTGAPGTVEAGSQPEKEPPGDFPTGYFEDRQHIMEWFGA